MREGARGVTFGRVAGGRYDRAGRAGVNFSSAAEMTSATARAGGAGGIVQRGLVGGGEQGGERGLIVLHALDDEFAVEFVLSAHFRTKQANAFPAFKCFGQIFGELPDGFGRRLEAGLTEQQGDSVVTVLQAAVEGGFFRGQGDQRVGIAGDQQFLFVRKDGAETFEQIQFSFDQLSETGAGSGRDGHLCVESSSRTLLSRPSAMRSGSI